MRIAGFQTGEFELKEFHEALMFGFLFVFVQTIRTLYQTMLGFDICSLFIYTHVYMHLYV